MHRWAGVLLALLMNGFLVGQMWVVRGAALSPGPAEAVVVREDEVHRRPVKAGERTVLEVSTTGLLEVVVYERTGDARELEEFRAGRVPRTAKVFSQVRELSYPLSSVTDTEFYVRVRHLRPGETRLRYVPGLVDEAMARLRKGENLVRNRGVVVVEGGRLTMPVYQLVPGTVVRVEVQSGRGVVGLLKTRDYLDVRDGRATVAGRCTPQACVEASSGRAVLEVAVGDYDDRYLVAEGQGLVFTYRVVATPEVLNHISSCT
ncbi:MAG: hypothetical protein RMM30_09740 [Armatimonadota bacterium]|nr:hypothetical protein [Armatimonadota bacterium]MDW8156850.1 hypothetical protein [Armatimonadota bacterium]